jgi:hypothetical protein
MHDDRWLQVDVCDYDAPSERRWRVTIIDRQTHAAGTATGRAARKTFDAAPRGLPWGCRQQPDSAHKPERSLSDLGLVERFPDQLPPSAPKRIPA